jgi:glutamyl-tRNA synthetase
VESPGTLKVLKTPAKKALNKLHPTIEMGVRTTKLKAGEQDFLLNHDDLKILQKGSFIRLMGAYNVEITKSSANQATGHFHSTDLETAKKKGGRLINWVEPAEAIEMEVISSEKKYNGMCEKDLKNTVVGDVVQLERFGFVRIDDKKDKITAFFAHK